MKWAGRIAGLLVVAALLYVFIKGLSPNRDPNKVPSAMICKKAPAFDLSGLSDPRVTLKPGQGGYTLVNFWASWCPTCKLEHSHLVSLVNDPPQEDFRVVGVLFDDTRKEALIAEKRDGKVAPTAVDEDGSVSMDYGVRSTPETFIINPKGLIVEKFEGAITREEIERVLARESARPRCEAERS